ncbi:MAG: threonine-phosphate decarboxylase [Rhizobiales bacterium]|nr:threonine-phosphate decarboxylase [Hyphomicrobiales bacterium]
MAKQLYHGGALDAAILQYGGNVDDWLDLSTGINPNAYEIDAINPLAWQQLPQKSALLALENAAKLAYQCRDAHVAIGNGTQVFIENLPRLFAKSTIAICAPTYEEHAENWAKHGHKVELVNHVIDAQDADHLLIVNPNNPTGKLYSPEQLLELHAHYQQKNGYLIIDEAFMDMTPKMSMSQYAGMDNLIILRSFGKFFGLAGVRVGFMLGCKKIIDVMQTHISLWAVSGASVEIATKALQNLEWQDKMRLTLKNDMQQMQHILTDNGFNIIGTTDLFCLVSMPSKQYGAYKYFGKLAEQHILTRKFNGDDEILRLGLVKAASQSHLAAKLKQICLELCQ